MNRRNFLVSALGATTLKIEELPAQSGPLIPPRADLPMTKIRSGSCEIEVRAELAPGSVLVPGAVLTLNYLYLTIIPLNEKVANSRRPVAVDLYVAVMLEPNDERPLSTSAEARQKPIETLALTHKGLIYRVTGQLWLLVNQFLLSGVNESAAVSEVPPGGQVSVTLARGTTATLEIFEAK